MQNVSSRYPLLFRKSEYPVFYDVPRAGVGASRRCGVVLQRYRNCRYFSHWLAFYDRRYKYRENVAVLASHASLPPVKPLYAWFSLKFSSWQSDTEPLFYRITPLL